MLERIIARRLRFFVIDGYRVARETGLGGRFNTVMQTCFFALSGVLPRDQAISAIKGAIQKTFGKCGEAVVRKNWEAVDQALAHLYEVPVPAAATSALRVRLPVAPEAPNFVQRVTGPLIAGQGADRQVVAPPPDGTFPVGTASWERRNLALEIPVWDEDLCIQCGKCVLVCPHAVIREKVYEERCLEGASSTFKSARALARVPRLALHPAGGP